MQAFSPGVERAHQEREILVTLCQERQVGGAVHHFQIGIAQTCEV